MHLNEVSKYLGNLMRADQIRAERKKTTVYTPPQAGMISNLKVDVIEPVLPAVWIK